MELVRFALLRVLVTLLALLFFHGHLVLLYEVNFFFFLQPLFCAKQAFSVLLKSFADIAVLLAV